MLLSQHSLLLFRKFVIVFAKKPISIFICFLVLVLSVNSQTLPKGFSQVLVATGLPAPTVMAFAPDGRLFVAQQAGILRIIKNSVLLSAPFITLKVNSRGERGLLGIAFDPAFSTNKYIYLYYTDTSGTFNRISRFTANGDFVVPGSEVKLLKLSPLSAAVNHNGGNMVFGKDGKLYVGIGDNANSANAQNLDTYLGKVLRINPDGSAPADNPFTTGSEERKRIWAYGMRNPYTLSVQPVTGRIFVNDVGQDTWEEVNDCTTGGHNYGWPLAEGMDSTSRFTNPVYVYGHGTGSGLGCAIAGGTFFNPVKTNYPSSYIGNYFFLDYCGRWINMISLKNSTPVRSDFVSGVRRDPVGMATGPDGNLYFLSRIIGDVYKITYTTSSVPVIDEQPVSITVSKGNPASFFIKASSTDTLRYQWRKNGVNITGATNATYKTSAVVYADSGTYSVVVSNNAGSVTSHNAVLKVTPPNQTPVAVINTPLKGATYAAGNKISFSGSGSDAEDGTLSTAAFKWFVLFYHNTHTHPGPTIASGITSGSFTIPDIGETSSNVFYRLYLIVTDSRGATDTSHTDILPRKSLITIKTNPANLQITLDGQPFTSPKTVTSVEGMKRTIGVITPQGIYKFTNWSNGGSATQTIATPVNDVIYTANFSATITDTILPAADAFVRSGVYADTNYGKDTSLHAKKTETLDFARKIFLKFNISSFTPEVSSARLRLYGALNTTQDSSVPIEVHNAVDTSWSETSISWNNSPPADTSILAIQTIAGTAKKYYDWDITHQIRSLKKAGMKYVTLELINTNITLSRADFNSKEAYNKKPKLVVTYSSIASKPNIVQVVSNGKMNKETFFSVFPNPAKNSFSLSFQNYSKSAALKLYDINGRLIRDIAITSSKVQRVSVADLKNGVYILNLIDGKKSVSKKIVIEK
jgi:glucose/arabinose dehydrogenase